jgi:hypothetical protein
MSEKEVDSPDVDPAEAAEIQRIAIDFFRSESKSEDEAAKAMQRLVHTVKEPGAKLIHIGNVLFLIMVRAKNAVEVHTIGNEKSPRDLANDFVQLVQYLKHIGVKTAYTFTEDNRFWRLAQMTKLPVKAFKSTVEGKPVNVYVMEL